MALEHFRNYIDAYAEEYYARYILDLNQIGDVFCCMRNDGDLHAWIIESNICGTHFYHKSAGPPIFSLPVQMCDTVERDTSLPAYAVALREFFYKDYLYPEMKNAPAETRRMTDLEQNLANVCHAGRSTVSSWKSGTRIPDKYKWWVLAIAVFKLSYWHIQPFLDMIGCSIDMTCLDDVILFYSVCTSKTMYETFVLLNEYGCDETKKLFTAAQ